ncbi:MAG: hypothetical protein WCE75_10125, partial [Terracidiphilus sp.]
SNGTPAATQTAEWKTYTYASDGFSISFPTAPDVKKQNVPTQKGTFELRAYVSQPGESALYVGVCDYGTAVEGRDPDDVLAGAQDGALQNVQAKLTTGRKFTFGIYHGVEFEGDSATMHFSARIYLVGTTLYQTLVASPVARPYGETPRFLNSFQLIARDAK